MQPDAAFWKDQYYELRARFGDLRKRNDKVRAAETRADVKARKIEAQLATIEGTLSVDAKVAVHRADIAEQDLRRAELKNAKLRRRLSGEARLARLSEARPRRSDEAWPRDNEPPVERGAETERALLERLLLLLQGHAPRATAPLNKRRPQHVVLVDRVGACGEDERLFTLTRQSLAHAAKLREAVAEKDDEILRLTRRLDQTRQEAPPASEEGSERRAQRAQRHGRHRNEEQELDSPRNSPRSNHPRVEDHAPSNHEEEKPPSPAVETTAKSPLELIAAEQSFRLEEFEASLEAREADLMEAQVEAEESRALVEELRAQISTASRDDLTARDDELAALREAAREAKEAAEKDQATISTLRAAAEEAKSEEEVVASAPPQAPAADVTTTREGEDSWASAAAFEDWLEKLTTDFNSAAPSSSAEEEEEEEAALGHSTTVNVELRRVDLELAEAPPSSFLRRLESESARCVVAVRATRLALRSSPAPLSGDDYLDVAAGEHLNFSMVAQEDFYVQRDGREGWVPKGGFIFSRGELAFAEDTELLLLGEHDEQLVLDVAAGTTLCYDRVSCSSNEISYHLADSDAWYTTTAHAGNFAAALRATPKSAVRRSAVLSFADGPSLAAFYSTHLARFAAVVERRNGQPVHIRLAIPIGGSLEEVTLRLRSARFEAKEHCSLMLTDVPRLLTLGVKLAREAARAENDNLLPRPRRDALEAVEAAAFEQIRTDDLRLALVEGLSASVLQAADDLQAQLWALIRLEITTQPDDGSTAEVEPPQEEEALPVYSWNLDAPCSSSGPPPPPPGAKSSAVDDPAHTGPGWCLVR